MQPAQNKRATGKKATGSLREARSPRSGFTLVELLAVMAIMAILASLVLGLGGYAWRQAKLGRARTELAGLEMALARYKVFLSRYPVAGGARGDATNHAATLYWALAVAYTNKSKVFYQFSSDQLRTNGAQVFAADPWRNAYNYYYTEPAAADQVNQFGFDLWSCGPDGQSGTADDIVNWKR
jgi:general secretion pathway protein G